MRTLVRPLLLIVLVLPASVALQWGRCGATKDELIMRFVALAAQPAPRLVGSYNDKIHGSEAEQWHLEDFMKLLVAEPSSKAYIIAYAGREDHPGKSRRYALRAKNYLVEG